MDVASPQRQTKGERTQARLLDIAIRRFADAGFRATSVTEIAREAGLTPAAAYAYFPEGKDGLFLAAVDADAAGLVADARAAAPAGPVRERWLNLFLNLVAGLGQHPLANRVLAGREPEVVDRLLTLPTLAEMQAGLAADLAAGQRTGAVRPDIDPTVLAAGLQTIVLALLMGQVQSDAIPDPVRRAGVLAVLDAALRPAPTPTQGVNP